MRDVQLRDYQLAAVEMIRGGIRAGHRKQAVMSPTGSGKTEIACHLLHECAVKRSRAIFIVDRVVLVDQTSERLDRYGIEHGVMQSGHWRTRLHERIQICSAQTLERRGIPDDVSVVFVDEAHCMREQVTEFLLSTKAVVMGLTATPFTKGMGRVYSNLVNVTTMNQLIDQQFLVPLKTYAAKAIDVAGMKVVRGEWAEKDIEKRGLEIVGDIVSEWQSKTSEHFGGPVKTIVFSATVDHGEELCRQFKAAGFRFEQISYRDGGDDHRRALIEEFRKPDSSILGLVSCEVFTKGFDVPDVLCGISARPYRKSLSSHMQQLGRVMRPAPGKEFGLWLCHSGNVLRFREDVDRIFEEGMRELDDGRIESKARKEPTEKEREEYRCGACGLVMTAFQRKCPHCGHEKPRLSMVEHLPGEMVAVEGKQANQAYTWERKREFMGGLRSYADTRGYSEGWVAHKYREKFGVWPNDIRVSGAPPGPVSSEVSNFIKSQLIRFAKSKQQATA